MASEREEMIDEYPAAYERIDGSVLGERWAGRDVPIPPKWVREQVTAPRETTYASLHRELADMFDPAARDVLVRYIMDWDSRVNRYGYHLLIGGPSSHWRIKRWAAAAVQHEIVLRWGGAVTLSTAWTSPAWARVILAQKNHRYDSFVAERARLQNTHLLCIENVTSLPSESAERWFLEDLYESRINKGLPTIVTINAELGEETAFDHATAVIGPHFVARLRDMAEYFMVNL
jgi:hypothetical protein